MHDRLQARREAERVRRAQTLADELRARRGVAAAFAADPSVIIVDFSSRRVVRGFDPAAFPDDIC